jgi:predicted transcriptional regulator
MRTTVTLSDEAAELVNQYAESARVSRSRAVSDLIVRSTRRKARIKLVNGIPVFDIPGGRRVTTEEAKRLEVDEL